ncbi:MAG: AIM24 family protein [Clostridium sp.]|uniref:AIM24 family protein n=1 Tax=Clostridium sp. TaxID=1506 RepID=UPI003F3873B7
MRTSLKFENTLTMLAQMTNDSRFQVLEFDKLNGATDIDTAFDLNIMKKAGVKLKQIRIILDESKVKIESGALSYMKGDIKIVNKLNGVIGMSKKFISSKLTGEEMFKPSYEGRGEIFLEPSFKHYALIELEDDRIIVDDGMFLACEDGVEVTHSGQKTISSMIFGNEGIFQTKIYGTGIVALEIPVPEEEIFKCKLNEDVLKVDGSFAILRTGDIEFSVEKSATTMIGSATSGEGLLNVYRGTGDVWLIPTKVVYDKMRSVNDKDSLKEEVFEDE